MAQGGGRPENDDTYFVSKTRAIIFVVVVIVLAVVVGLIAGLTANASTHQVGGTQQPTSGPNDGQPWMKLKLPNNVKPVTYDLFLHPQINGDSFSGKVSMIVEVSGNTKYILVHRRGLTITQSSLQTVGAAPRKIEIRNFENDKNEFYVIETLSETLQAGQKYNATYIYNGKYPSVLYGLYKSTYKDPEGNTKTMVTSDFEPLDARMALPCMDEPTLKANFTTTMVRPTNGYIALSNMPEERSWQYDASNTAVKFKPTVIMSTYLLAFIICDFKYTASRTNNNVDIRIYAPPHLVNTTQYAATTTKVMFEYFNTLTTLPYDLPKSDLIAIPDFNSGAMENWGLITFRTTYLLYDPMATSIFDKQIVAIVISHELVHQWFGNLVTLKWWDDLWLNEGFASYLEYGGVDHVHPDWGMMKQFLSSDFFSIMGRDSLVSSRPINALSETPAAIKQMFDRITYSKGAVAVRMIEGILTNAEFWKGNRAYLKKYAYSNANTKDLFDTYTTSMNSKMNVGTVMDPWVRQKNFPVVTIASPVNGRSTVTQKRFLIDASSATNDSPFNYEWYVPFNYKTSSSNTIVSNWLNRTSTVINYPSSGWIKANVGQIGFYIVNYPQTNWMALQTALETNVNALDSGDRAGLINDAFLLARANVIVQSLALGMTKYLSKETEYVPWNQALSSLGYFNTILGMRPAYADFKTYMTNLIRPRYNALGWNDTGSHLDKYARRDMLLWVIRLNYGPAMDEAKMIYSRWMKGQAQISPNVRLRALRAGIAAGGMMEWDFAWNKYLTASAGEKSELMYAMAFSRTPWVLNRYLQRAMNTTLVRSQDTLTIIRYVSYTELGTPIAWNFFQSNWNELHKRYGQVTFGLARAIETITSGFSTDFQLKEVEHFFATAKGIDSISNSKKTILETIKGNIAWLKRNEKDVSDWLAANKNI